MNTYILLDTMNLAHRAKHVAAKGDINMQIGMSFHIIFNSLLKVWNKFDADAVIAAFEGKSWRKAKAATYKANRAEMRAKRTPREIENDQAFFGALNDLQEYLTERTNVTCLRGENLEGDDLIAMWIKNHPDDQHIIVSSDSDFQQLLAPNVIIYDGIKRVVYSIDSVVDDDGKTVFDKKTKTPVPPPCPEWELFYKCIRGDSSDNIFPAYPGARERGTKNKIGMREAFADRHTKGYNWNNFMLTRWVDENGEEHRVLDKFNHNLSLVDLTAQPEDIKEQGRTVINEAKALEKAVDVGFNFMKFCHTWGLTKISQNPEAYGKMLGARVKNVQ